MSIKTEKYDPIMLAVSHHLDLKNYNVDYIETFSENLQITLRKYIHGLETHRITVNEKWPNDWWQAFKDRWFPKFLLDRYPVEYKTISIDQPIYGKVYTDLNTPNLKIPVEVFSLTNQY
jgi:hypothetical protein